MYARILGVVTGMTICALQAQTLDLRGRVMANGAPVADATVLLKTKKDSVKTGADGTFALGGNVSVGKVAGRMFDYRFEPGFLAIDLKTPLDLQLEIVDGAGHAQGGLSRQLGVGHHRIALADAMPVSVGNAGSYFLRMRLGGESFTHPFVQSGTGAAGTVFAPALRVAAKLAAVVDTLIIRKTGYQNLTKEVTSYTAGNLGDLALTAASADGWVNLYNGKDLSNWIPLIHGFKVGNNVDSTFRPDVANNMISVRYDKYPNLNFADRCGNLYYNKLLTNYRIRVTYRFVEPQAKNPVSWGKYNSGLMIFAIDPAKVTGDPEFPPLIELQILGQGSPGGSGSGPTTNLNYCFPNGMTMKTHSADCGNNHTGKAAPAPDQWTTIEADVSVTGVTKVYQLPDTTNPLETMSGPMYNNQPVTGGYVTLQSESQPLDFKDILLKELP
jgi:hypothetical protein